MSTTTTRRPRGGTQRKAWQFFKQNRGQGICLNIEDLEEALGNGDGALSRPEQEVLRWYEDNKGKLSMGEFSLPHFGCNSGTNTCNKDWCGRFLSVLQQMGLA